MKKTFFWGCLGVLCFASASTVLAQDAQSSSATTASADAPSTPSAEPAATDQSPIAQTTATAEEPGVVTAEGTASAQVDEPAAEAAPAPPAKLFWRNSMFWVDQSISAYTLAPGGALTYNPTYALNFRFLPRVYLLDKLFLRARFDLNVELTQSDFTSTNRQPMFSDIFLDAISPGIFHYDNFNITAGARLVLPTSIMSQADNLYFGAGFLANFSYNFPSIGDGLTFLFDLAYTYNVRGSNVTSVDQGYGCAGLDGRAGRVCTQTGGPSNLRMTTSLGPTINFVPIERLNITAVYSFMWRVANDLGTATVPTASGPITLADNSRTHDRNWQMFYFGVAYDVLDWLNLSVYYYALTTQFSPNGAARNPFFNYDATIGLTATFTLDQLYEELTGHGPELTPEQLRRIRNGQAQNNSTLRGVTF